MENLEDLNADRNIIFDLTSKTSTVERFEIPPNDRTLGGSTPDIEEGKIRLYIGSRPTSLNLKKLYGKLGKKIPPEIQLFKSYNAYILTHRVGVIKEGGFKSVNQVGYRVKFPDNPAVIILDLMPQAKFIKKIGVNFNFEADLSINGQLGIPDGLTQFLEKNVEYMSLGGKLKAATNDSLVGRFSFSVQTPEVMAIGKGNTYSEWVFNTSEKPLYGSDLEMFQVILVEKFADSITFEVMIYSVISTWNLLPARRQSDWVKLECVLD